MIFERLATILRNENQIDLTVHKEQLKAMHQLMYNKIIDKSDVQARNSYLVKLLLNDMDLCMKFFLTFIVEEANVEVFVEDEIVHASVVSDTRVSVLKDLLNAFANHKSSSPLLSPSEVAGVMKEIEVKNVILLNTSGKLKDLKKKLAAPYIVNEYFILRDFSVDWEVLEKIRYSFCYFIIDSQLTVAEYNALINTCIKNAVTPLFVLYVPEENKKVAKEMYKTRWIVTLVHCRSFNDILSYLKDSENNLICDLNQYASYYDNFKATLGHSVKREEKGNFSKEEADGGWEILSTIDKSVFNQLVEELSMGTRLVGSLHYYLLKEFKEQSKQDIYWKNYAQLFGITEKYATTLDLSFGKCLLHAYTLQTDPPFYKLLNDAFRTGTEESVAKFRAFFSLLHDLVKKKILKKYIGSVYRGTYFNEQSMKELRVGEKIHSTCFTSTSKSESVAREFARRARRNVLLEIELNAGAATNVDIHEERCSKYVEEQEVLLLPFATFEVMRVFWEEKLAVVSLREVIPEYETVSLKGIEYNN
eukprot:TRINITY_DN12651_c0_g5_i1.p1 TRINITY_DN12651_c0_g5~~TRINITY_DN12651_c0_g5_i1.p1  ORF type:complete len:606 (+),score=161.73 TRINITY_DN12651_c0_g5_i1:220-1818(+)